MPVYEYEHVYDESEMCELRFGVVQSLEEEDLKFCPSCGLEVKRVVSRISIVKTQNFHASKAAQKGFTTWKKSGVGEWEKVDGPGVDALISSAEDKAAIAEERVKSIDLDSE